MLSYFDYQREVKASQVFLPLFLPLLTLPQFGNPGEALNCSALPYLALPNTVLPCTA